VAETKPGLILAARARIKPGFFLALVGAAALTTASPRAQNTPAEAAAVTRLADEFVDATFERWPEVATFYGAPLARHDRVFDNSPEAKRAWDQRVDRFAESLQAIDRAALAGRPELVTYGFLRQAIGSDIERRVCRAELWGVDQMYGWQVSIPTFLTRQPVATAAERRAASERLRQYPKFIDQEIATLRRGLAAGYTAPRVAVDRVIAQMDALLNADAAAHPFAPFAKASDDAAFSRTVAETMAKEVVPSMRRYRSFLDEYRGVARTEVGVAELPQGDACYRGLMRDTTSLELTADEVHRLGLEQMEQIHAEMRAIAARAFGTSDVPALLARLRTDPALRFRSGEEIMRMATAALDRARAAMPRYFGRLPKADVLIAAFEPFEAPSMPPAMYRPPSLDGRTPGQYMVNLYQPEQSVRADVEAVAFHEAIPGHHLQIALAMERPAAHRITQLFGTTAFVEGWGLYAERLADEMGLYSGDLDRLGMLSAQAWRAARLVVDTGMHAKKWPRQQAVEYMRRNTAVGENVIQTEIDRYIIMPGQAIAYMIGYREITSLRARAQSALGARFDIRAFHDAVLGGGAVTLPMLREQIEEWIGAR
jgi:uncharacterized protein (DUF885 family)